MSSPLWNVWCAHAREVYGPRPTTLHKAAVVWLGVIWCHREGLP